MRGCVETHGRASLRNYHKTNIHTKTRKKDIKIPCPCLFDCTGMELRMHWHGFPDALAWNPDPMVETHGRRDAPPCVSTMGEYTT